MNTDVSLKLVERTAEELGLSGPAVRAVVGLLDADSTVPFIARYRKEVSGGMDELQIIAVRDRILQLRDLEARRSAILVSLAERELLTDDLQSAVDAAGTMAELEDIYLPFRPKRRTRASIAREKGLEPLADLLYRQDPEVDPVEAARQFIDEQKGVATPDDALAGASDIIAERLNEDAGLRGEIRELFSRSAVIVSRSVKGGEEEGSKFRDYFDWREPLASAPSHRILAMRRGENEGYLTLHIEVPEPEALAIMHRHAVINGSPSAEFVKAACADSFNRLLSVSMETEMRAESRRTADRDAITVFAGNVRDLLMAPPLGQKRILAVDPGFRTGCKTVCLDAQGKLLHHETLFPHNGTAEAGRAATRFKELCHDYSIEYIAVGNGTAGRETEMFLRDCGIPVPVVMVNESGASVYSASDVARQEFPDKDITVRGAVSIGRRLMDPLAELVKIDPKSIGVGQYQHDVDQKDLKQSLDDTVMSCVNTVGVNLNTASEQLLMAVSGLGQKLAANVIAYRNEHGPFRDRKTLLKVSRLGPKAFEQAAGFLRIPDSVHPLDGSAVHPERYEIVERMASDLGCSVRDLMLDEELRKKIKLANYISESAGIPTLMDIITELAKPGRDPRAAFEICRFDDAIRSMEDLKAGMRLPGIVTNVTRFGAFVDIGVHQDGLVHISQLADRFVRDPSEIVKVRQVVEVTVLEVDPVRRRISLSIKKNP